MRLDLRQLSLADTRLALPPAHGQAQFIELGELKSLQGTLSLDGGALRLSHVSGELVRVASGALRFGAVALGVDAPLSLSRPKLELRSLASALRLDLSSEHAEAASLTVEVHGASAGVVLAAKLMLRGLRVHVTEELGRIEASYAELSAVTLRLGTLTLRAPHLVAHELALGWGGSSGFTLTAGSARALDLEAVLSGARLHALGVTCSGLRVRDGGLSVREAGADHVRAQRAEASPPAEAQPVPAAASARPARPLADLSLLDALSGHVRCDLTAHMSVSVLPRRARHRVRLDVAHGTIDYRSLEQGLAPLEEALLDFGVRGDALVLKLGLPLLRGRGKTLVRWPLPEADRALAESRRVRLRVLAAPERRDADDESADDAREGPLRLHALDARDVDVELTLAPTELSGTALRQLAAERLRVEGEVHVRGEGEGAEGDDDGRLDLEAKGLRVSLAELALGAQALSVGELAVNGALDGRVDLQGLRVSDWSIEASDLALRELDLAGG